MSKETSSGSVNDKRETDPTRWGSKNVLSMKEYESFRGRV